MGFYNLNNLEQGSAKWLAWRRTVVGASDAPTVMGENPWAKPAYLMQEKMGLTREFGGNDATREGQRLELFARQALEKESGLKLAPTIIQDEEHPFLAASLDAISKDFKHLFEIKCGKKSYEYVAENRKVPSYYYGQLQHMLMITQLSVMYLTVYRPDQKMLTLQVPYDEAYIHKLRNTELKFVDELVDRGHKIQDKFHGKLID
jgi:putative phage-type endonuclease